MSMWHKEREKLLTFHTTFPQTASMGTEILAQKEILTSIYSLDICSASFALKPSDAPGSGDNALAIMESTKFMCLDPPQVIANFINS